MSYLTLKKFGYNNHYDIEAEYEKRFHSEYAHHINFDIEGYSAFFIETPDISKKLLAAHKLDKLIQLMRADLPASAIKQFEKKCLIEEIIQTNAIEGVNSTKKEITDAIKHNSDESKQSQDRFWGLVNKYLLFLNEDFEKITTCQDIRTIYDKTLLDEVISTNKTLSPDGKIFRKDTAYVQNTHQGIVHYGVYPEEKIISQMNNALNYANDTNEDVLLRAIVFHFCFEYIHPFYDGNGRLGRMLLNGMLIEEFDKLISVRLSYTIAAMKPSYYKAFRECDDKKNCGEITYFVDTMLDIILSAMQKLFEALHTRKLNWKTYNLSIKYLPNADDKTTEKIYEELITASIFSDAGVSMKELEITLPYSKSTIINRLTIIPENLIKKTKSWNEVYYSINLDEIEKYVMANQ